MSTDTPFLQMVRDIERVKLEIDRLGDDVASKQDLQALRETIREEARACVGDQCKIYDEKLAKIDAALEKTVGEGEEQVETVAADELWGHPKYGAKVRESVLQDAEFLNELRQAFLGDLDLDEVKVLLSRLDGTDWMQLLQDLPSGLQSAASSMGIAIPSAEGTGL